MSQPGGFDAEAMLLGYSAGELSAEEERALFEAAARDQDLFDQLMEAETVRNALSFPEERVRAAAVLRAWEEPGIHTGNVEPVPIRPAAALRPVPPPRMPGPEVAPHAHLGSGQPQRVRGLSMDVLRSVVSTLATTLSLRLCYALITAVGSSLVIPQVQTGAPQARVFRRFPRSCIWCMRPSRRFCWRSSSRRSCGRRRAPNGITRSHESVSPSSSRGGAGHGPRGWRCTAGSG